MIQEVCVILMSGKDELINYSLVEGLNGLLRQLSSSKGPFTEDGVRDMVNKGNWIFVIADQEVGSNKFLSCKAMATLCHISKLSGSYAEIHDVVVAVPYRRKGYGKAIVSKVLEYADIWCIPHIDLTSRPQRAEANSLYLKLGFQKRNTNCYRYSRRL